LLAKTESSEYGIFVTDGTPEFSVHLDGRYRTAKSTDTTLKAASGSTSRASSTATKSGSTSTAT
jgi:hypothetical protein